MSEPDFIAQTAEPKTMEAVREWFADVASEAAVDLGVTWFRYTRHDDMWLWLVEGWKNRPVDEGNPRFQLGLANDL